GPRAALVQRTAPCVVVADDAGLLAATLDPPRPPAPFETWADQFQLEQEWFLPTGSHALALLRSDTFTYGEYTGTERQSVTGFESQVMGRHSKGGFSQARFERRREEQVSAHLEKVREFIDDRNPDRLFLVGEGEVIDRLSDRATATGRVDATGQSAEALDAAAREFWTTTVRGL
ncbi:MAG: Vms1/Ankzf1 family peptidyl-tRNA hydrolase, partial [Halobacteriales archaeon]|nr:Vms1/Ankzf1 family peptidyl-tRNA hydrolase [Halobacteriales archaeon]